MKTRIGLFLVAALCFALPSAQACMDCVPGVPGSQNGWCVWVEYGQIACDLYPCEGGGICGCDLVGPLCDDGQPQAELSLGAQWRIASIEVQTPRGTQITRPGELVAEQRTQRQIH